MSYNIIDNRISALLTEGVELIQAKYLYYNKDKLIDENSNKKYSVQMIEDSLNIKGEMNEILKMIIFDCLIGNSDRHHSNWAEINTVEQKDKYFICQWFISPLYDNGSSLCSYVNEEDIDLILKDNMRFEALINTKSKSTIGWNDERPIKHFDLLVKIKENYFDDTKECIRIIKENINENNIEKLLNEFSDNIISVSMKKLLKKFIIERRNRMLKIYDMKEG